MPEISRPPSRGGNFLKPRTVNKQLGDKIKVKILRVKGEQDLPNSGPTTVLDVDYQGKTYGLALNVGAHRAMCKLFGNIQTEKFPSEAAEGKEIELQVRTAPNPKEAGEDTEVFRIVVPEPKK